MAGPISATFNRTGIQQHQIVTGTWMRIIGIGGVEGRHWI